MTPGRIAIFVAGFALAQAMPSLAEETGHWSMEGESYVRGETHSTGRAIEGSYQIGGLDVGRIGLLRVKNLSDQRRGLRIASVDPGYEAGQPDKVFWFLGNYARGMSTEPGSEGEIFVSFVGHKAGSGVWVDDGIYEGLMVLEDTVDGTRYEVPLTAFAFRPGG